jgi:hypothetical protein
MHDLVESMGLSSLERVGVYKMIEELVRLQMRFCRPGWEPGRATRMQARLRSFAIRLEIDDSTMNSVTEMLEKIQVLPPPPFRHSSRWELYLCQGRRA